MEKKASAGKSVYLILAIIVLIITVVAVKRTYRNGQLSPFDVTVPRGESADPDQKSPVSPQIDAILENARSFQAVGPEFYGTKAPEMVLTDVNGKVHKLSESLGKDVLVIFWATWCPPCNMELPHLIELRKTQPADKLEMLAISSEQGGIETVRAFAKDKGLNYNVIWTEHSKMPVPFSHATSLPTAFFIDKQGRFKLITIGMMDGESTLAVLKAPSIDKPVE